MNFISPLLGAHDVVLDWQDELDACPNLDDVIDEYHSEAPQLDSDARAWLLKQGLRDHVLEGVTECVSGYVLEGDYWRFKINPPEGCQTSALRKCFHVPVFRDGHCGNFVDLVRFTREYPNVSHLRHGGRVCRVATWLGAPVEPGARKWAEPTPIWRSPLKWLKNERKGLCYLRMSWPSERLSLLRQLPAIIGEDAKHSFYLDRATWSDSDIEKPPAWARIRKSPDFAQYISDQVVPA